VNDVIGAARLIRDQRYAEASAVFAAGSLVRGEGTAHSDLDLVVVYPKVSCAARARGPDLVREVVSSSRSSCGNRLF
jgi:predicted nucleotidyltransferase